MGTRLVPGRPESASRRVSVLTEPDLGGAGACGQRAQLVALPYVLYYVGETSRGVVVHMFYVTHNFLTGVGRNISTY